MRAFQRLGLMVLLGIVLCGAAFGQSLAFALSFGVATGDFKNSFVGGVSGDFRVLSFLHGEVEYFYYRMPAPRSTNPGEAITSTAIDMNASLVLQPVEVKVKGIKFIPYVLLTGGTLYESETLKYSATRTHTHRSYSRWDTGAGLGLKVILGFNSGIRFDVRWIRILRKDQIVPRFALGYMLFI